MLKVLSVLMAALVAAEVKIPDDIAGSYGRMQEEKPKPCCAPAYFTYKSTHFLTYSLGDGISVEMQVASEAHDNIAKRRASKIHLGFFNGTEEYYHTIHDYAAHEEYTISMFSGELTCRKRELEERFREDCIPEKATYFGTQSLGDRKMEVDAWYILDKQPGFDEHRVVTYQKDECILVYSTIRHLSPENVTYSTQNDHVYDFKLGICEEEEREFFHVPDICHERAVSGDSKIPAESLKKINRMHPKLRSGL